jgi:flagellar hook-associated protein 1 FlgK
MGNLSGIIGSATRSLSTFSEALGVIQNNIANAATPGYARQRPSLAPIIAPQGSRQGLGVEITQIETLRDQLLESQLFFANQSRSFFEKSSQLLAQIEPTFKLVGDNSVGQSIDNFFRSVSALSVAPEDFNLRRAVIGAADTLADVFRQANADLSQQRTNLDTEVTSIVSRVNRLLSNAASLASKRGIGDGPATSSVETRLTQVFTELSTLIGFRVQSQRDGTLSVISDTGAPLLVGETVFPLSVGLGSEQIQIRDFKGNDITADLGSSGSLGAIVETRNQTIPGLLADVDRLAKAVADQVNEQFLRGATATGGPGKAIFDYATSFVEGSGRTAGASGAATPAPPVSIDVTISGGVTGSISASLDSFFVAAGPPAGAVAGDTVSVTFTSADGEIERTITTSPLLGGEDAAALATRLNDQLALDPELAGVISFSDSGGSLKAVVSDQAGQGFSFTASTSSGVFTSGLESGGSLGGHSAREIADALNAEVLSDPALVAAGIRFSAVQGEVRIDGDEGFDFTLADNDPAATGFVSGLAGSGSAGGAPVASTIQVANIGPADVSAGTFATPLGNENALAVGALADADLIAGFRFTDFYANLVSEVGDAAGSAASEFETQQQVFAAAQSIRDSFSGVDVNEEAVRLVQYEKAFSAMLRVIQVVDDLSTEVLGLVR